MSISANGVDLSSFQFVGRSLCLSVGLFAWKVYCGKTADGIWMLFGILSGVGRGMGVLDRGGDRHGEGQFWR